jgi:hypothetical protein
LQQGITFHKSLGSIGLNFDLTATVAVTGVKVEVCRNIMTVFGEVVFKTELRSQVLKFPVTEIIDEVVGFA